MSQAMNDRLATRIHQYQNTATHNDDLYAEFTKLTDSIPWLKHHRDVIEQNSWGTGDRAFHYMWYLLLSDAAQSFSPIQCLEIGVFKGQIISLWAKIAKELGLDVLITAISPLEGNTKSTSKLGHKVKTLVDPKYRQLAKEGNLYPADNYYQIIQNVFNTFELELSDINLIKGYSNAPNIVKKMQEKRFSIIYIDGDHSFEGTRADILNYVPLLEDGGYLIMDDASFFLPGETFWKGHKDVSKACETISSLSFINVINIGHNRVYKKIVNHSSNE
jgi:hypothetical protein